MGATLGGVDVVGERVGGFAVTVVPLERDLDVDQVALAVHVDRLVVDDGFVLVQVLDEFANTAFIQELVRLAVALVVDRDRHAGIEEGEFAQPLRQRFEAKVGCLENLGVGLKRDLGSALLGLTGDVEITGWNTAVVALLMHVTVAPDFQFKHFRQRVHDRDADAVQAAGNFIGGVFELAAGVKHRENDFRGRFTAFVHVDGNTAAVVNHGDGPVDMNRHIDVLAVPG